MNNVFTAIQSRDGDALARLTGSDRQYAGSDNVVNITAERLVDALFKQLKQLFPAAEQTNLKTPAQETAAKQQWIAAFAEGGIRTREQVSAGMRHARASESPFWPSPGQFIKWCKDSKMVLGVSIEDVMGEFHRYAKEKSFQPGGPERFPWRHPVMYWIVCDTRRAMYQRQLSEIEVEKHARKLLDEWAAKVADGHQIPDPVLSIQAKPEPIQTPENTGGECLPPSRQKLRMHAECSHPGRTDTGPVADGGIPARESGRTHQVAPARQRIFLRLHNYLVGNKICA